MNESQFPWVILVPRRDQVTEIYRLEEQDREQLQLESHLVSEKMMSHFEGHKLNIGALGNLVPQLHIHHIVRFDHDVCWPNPVWGNFQAKPYETKQLAKVRAELRDLLGL